MRWHKGIKELETTAEMDDDYRHLLVNLISIQADTEFASVQQLRPWLTKAPTVQDRWAVSKIIMEEMRHGWQMCQLLHSLGEHQEVHELLSRKMGEHKLHSFNIPFDTWSDLVMYNFLIDRVGRYQLREFLECSYAPLARAVPLMIEEEKFHIGNGLGGITRLCEDPDGRKEAQQAIFKWYPRGLDMFGRTGSKKNQAYLELGLKKNRNENLRTEYVAEVTPLILELGLELPVEDFDRRML